MIVVILNCQDGEFVTKAVIPPFQSMPDVLIWGTRVFKRHSDKEYRECFAVTVIPGMDGRSEQGKKMIAELEKITNS